jgi:hypothetical protein
MFYRLLLAHLVADFVLQTRWLVAHKRTPAGLAMHVGLVGLATLPVIWAQLAIWWPWLLLILAVHGATDWAKIKLAPRLGLPPILPFLADQAVHLLTLAAVVILAEPGGPGLAWRQSEAVWWVASAYVAATFALSIALPLWLDPPNLMRRPRAARPILIVAAALALTLAWRGWPLLIPVVGLGLYQVAARRLTRSPAAPSFAVEFWSAIVLAASLGWGLA